MYPSSWRRCQVLADSPESGSSRASAASSARVWWGVEQVGRSRCTRAGHRFASRNSLRATRPGVMQIASDCEFQRALDQAATIRENAYVWTDRVGASERDPRLFLESS